jgi:hypothetical protein
MATSSLLVASTWAPVLTVIAAFVLSTWLPMLELGDESRTLLAGSVWPGRRTSIRSAGPESVSLPSWWD